MVLSPGRLASPALAAARPPKARPARCGGRCTPAAAPASPAGSGRTRRILPAGSITLARFPDRSDSARPPRLTAGDGEVVAACKPSRRGLPAACQGLLRRPPPTDRVVAGPLRSLDQRHGRGALTPEQLPGSGASPTRSGCRPRTPRCRAAAAPDRGTPSRRAAPKRRQGAQLIGVTLPFLKTLGGRRRSQEAKIRELANERREQPSACAAWFLPPSAAAAHVGCRCRHVFASTDDGRSDRRKQHRIPEATPSRGAKCLASRPVLR